MRQKCALLCAAAFYSSMVLTAQTTGTQGQYGTQGQTTQSSSRGMTQNWTGRLVDADCYKVHPGVGCPVTESTTNFGIVTAGDKFYKLDTGKVANLRSMVQSSPQQQVTISGQLDTDTIRMESITTQPQTGAGNGAAINGANGPSAGAASGQRQTVSGHLYCPCGDQMTPGQKIGLVTPDGKFYRLDQDSSARAMREMQMRRGTYANGGTPQTNGNGVAQEGQTVTIHGRMVGDTLVIDSIDVK